MTSKIALAVADRPLVRRLIATQDIHVDYLETTGPLVDVELEALSPQVFLLHNSVWDWSLADPHSLQKEAFMDKTLALIQRLRVPWFSIHLGFSASQVVFDQGMRPLSAILEQGQLFETIVRNLRDLAAQLPVPLLIENLDYNPTGAYEHLCEPAFIAAVIEAASVGLLLDLAHARVSAARFHIPIHDYLQQLPLDHVQQLHISGPRVQETRLVDAHETLLEEDYQLLDWMLQRVAPRAITLEYGRDENSLKTQLSRLKTEIEGKA